MGKNIIFFVFFISLFNIRLSAQSHSMSGTWRLVSQESTQADGKTRFMDSSNLIQIKNFTADHFMVIAQVVIGGNKRFIFCSGGHYVLNGNECTEKNEYASYKGYELVHTDYSFMVKGDTMYQNGTVTHQDGNKSSFKEVYIREK